MSQLHGILSPVSVFEMSNEKVKRIAGESEESRAQREQLVRQLDVLRKGLETCKHFAGLKVGRGEFSLWRVMGNHADLCADTAF